MSSLLSGAPLGTVGGGVRPLGSVGSGGLSSLPPAAQRELVRRIARQKLGQKPQPPHHFFGFLDRYGLPGLAIDQIATSLVHTPAAVFHIGEGLVKDVADVGHGDLNFNRTLGVGKAIGQGIAQDFQHPLANPGNLAMDLFNIASLGAGTAARLGSAARAVEELKLSRLPPSEPPLLPPGAGVPRPLIPGEGGGAATAISDVTPLERSAQAARATEVGAPVVLKSNLTDLNRVADSVVRAGSPAGIHTVFLKASNEGLAGRLHLPDGGVVPLHSPEDAVRATRLYPQGKLSFSAEPLPPKVPMPGGEGLGPTPVGDQLPLDVKVEQVPKPNDLKLEGPTVKPQASATEVSSAAHETPLSQEKPLVEKPVAEQQPLPHVVADPESGFVGIKGTKLHIRPSELGGYRIFNGKRPVGPRIANPKLAIVHMVKHHMELKAGELSHLTNVPSVGEQAARVAASSAAVDRLSKAIDIVQEGGLPGMRKGEVYQLPQKTPRPTASADLKQGLKDTRTLPPGEAKVSERGSGLTPREMMVNQRALEQAGLDSPQAHTLTRRIAKDMRAAYEEAQAKGKEKPTPGAVLKVLRQHLPQDVADELHKRLYKAKGGAPISAREMIGAIYRGLTVRKGTSLSVSVVKDTTTGKVTPLDTYMKSLSYLPGSVDVERMIRARAKSPGAKIEIHDLSILASRNPLIKQFQAIQLGLLQSWHGGPLERVAGGGRTLEGLLKLHEREANRIRNDANIGQWGDQAAKDLADKRPSGLREHVAASVDTANQLAQIGVLYLKSSYYLSNLIGQLGVVAADHAWNPLSIIRSVVMQRQLYGKNGALAGEIAGRIKGAMQEGIVQSVAPSHGEIRMIGKLHSKLAKVSNKLLDTPFRDNAFLNEAYRQGFRSAEAIQDLVMNPAKEAEFLDVARRANKNIIDFGRLSPAEKSIIRRIIFFYPWIKASTIYAGHFFADHPAAAEVLTQQGRQEAVRANKELGPLPSYMEGVFKVGERDVPGLGKQPIVFNPLSETILGSGAQTLEALKEFATNHVHAANAPTQFLTPALSATLAATTGVDPFTGQNVKPGVGTFIQQLESTPAFMQTIQRYQRGQQIESGQLSANKILFPYTPGEAVGRFLGPGLADLANKVTGVKTGPAGGYAVNTAEARSRHFAEEKSFTSGAQREKLANQDYLRRYTEMGQKAKLFKSAPPDLRKAFALRADQMSNRELWAAKYGMKSNAIAPIVQLASDLDLLVRRGKMSQADAHQLLRAYGAVGEDKLRSFIRNLAETYFGAQTISYYKKQIKTVTGVAPSVP